MAAEQQQLRHGAGSGGGVAERGQSHPPPPPHQHIHLQAPSRAPPEEELHQFALHAHYAQTATTLMEVHHHSTGGGGATAVTTTGMNVNYAMRGKQVAMHPSQQHQHQLQAQHHPHDLKAMVPTHSFIAASVTDTTTATIDTATMATTTMHESLMPMSSALPTSAVAPVSALDVAQDEVSSTDAAAGHLSPDESKHESPAPPQLYKTSKMRRPELWQFIRLVVPDPPQIAMGKKYTNQDAKEAYCLKCKRMMHYNTGSSNNVSRHMAKFHPADLASYELKMSERKRNASHHSAVSGSGSGSHHHPHHQHHRDSSSSNNNGTAGRKRKLQSAHSAGGDAGHRPPCVDGRDDIGEYGDDDEEEFSADESDEVRKHPRKEHGPGSVGSSSSASEQAGAHGDNGRNTADIISSVVETERLNTLIAKWVCKHYHPFGITEDPEFQEIINFAINMKKSTMLPPQSEVRASVESLSARTRLDILHQLSSEAHFFSLATEIWTTTERDVFISFSVHYLTKTFDSRHFTLDVREYNGHLSPEERKEQVDMILTRWNLDPRCMNTILWDSYNPPPLENEYLPLHTAQTESVAHVIQCIIAPILHAQKELTMDDIPLFFVDEQVNSLVGLIPREFQHGVQYLREHVAAFRDLAWFLTNHPRAVLWMSKFMAGSAQIRLVVDSKTNWLSTVDMLRRLMRKREVIRDFFAYLETSEGRAEFQSSGIFARAAPGPEQWCAIECLLLLLQPFESVAVALCKDKYASSCLALALLRFLKRDLEKASDFQRVFASHSAGERDAEAKQKVAASLEVARRFLHTRFGEHFTKISDEYLWISQLDPRFVRMKFLADAERESCKSKLIERCLGLTNFLQSQKDKALAASNGGGSSGSGIGGGSGGVAVHSHHHSHHHESAASSSAAFLDFQTTKDDHDTNIFLRELLFDDNQEEAALTHHHSHHHASATGVTLGDMGDMGNGDVGVNDDANQSFEQQQELLRRRIAAEVDVYYQSAAAARVSAVRDPLHWWKDSARRLPLLAPLARKWLAAVGSVRPTETLEIPHTGMTASLSLGGNGSAAAAHHHHGNGAAHHYVAVHCDPELVRDMVFVHDNC